MRKEIPFKLDILARNNAPVEYLRQHLTEAHKILRPSLRELSLSLVGDRKMADLHTRFLGIAGSTDVLTFEIEQDARGNVIFGEVIVCTALAARESRRRGTTQREELLLYALHGMLHLCGMDDRTEVGFADMHAREDAILTALGVGAVFQRAAKPANQRRHPGAI